MSFSLTDKSSGTANVDLDLNTMFQADYYKPLFYGTKDSIVRAQDFSHGPPNTEESIVVECTETISLRVTPNPGQRHFHILDFVNAKNHKEQIGNPGLEIQECLNAENKLTLDPLGTWNAGDKVSPEIYQLHTNGLYEVYLNGECIRKVMFEHKPVSFL